MTDVLSKWVTDYRAAWDSNDPDDIAALFTEDALYYSEPFTAPARGREAIVQNWLDNADQPGDTTFEWKPVVETDEVGIIQAVTSYPHTIYSNLWVIRFADDGRATEFTDWWMEQGKAEPGEERE